MRALAWLPLLLLGCGTPPPCTTCGKTDAAFVPPDMPNPPGPDMTAPDLAEPADLAQKPDFAGLTFCANTPVAGTCLQAFAQPVSMCFNPVGACITMQDMQQGYANFCWPNGSKLLATINQMAAHGTWMNGKITCLEGDVGPGPTFTLTHAGQTLVYNESTGDVTCPDGSTTNVGPNYGSCADLRNLLAPDVGNCQPGACP